MLTQFKAIRYGYMLIYSFHQTLKKLQFHLKLNENSIILLFYPLFRHIWLLSKKIKGHQSFNLYQLLFSCSANEVGLPSKRGHVSLKACHTGFHYISPSMDGDYSNQGYLQGSLFRIHTNYPCPFCHTNFINQEEVIKHMKFFSGTDLKPEMLKLTCPYCQPTFETYEHIDKHI